MIETAVSPMSVVEDDYKPDLVDRAASPKE